MLCMCQILSSFYMPFWFDDKTIVHCVRQYYKLVSVVCVYVCVYVLPIVLLQRRNHDVFTYKSKKPGAAFHPTIKVFHHKEGCCSFVFLHTFHKRKRVIFNEIHIYFSFCYPMIPTHATALFIIADKNGY